ncbi:hypothetical protein BJ165DRAFT_564373 [Panaeolus papilionaceus]|nr:hypothetical protein BJ165DRAFT_564373 [Panaeolus papilionaceus]
MRRCCIVRQRWMDLGTTYTYRVAWLLTRQRAKVRSPGPVIRVSRSQVKATLSTAPRSCNRLQPTMVTGSDTIRLPNAEKFLRLAEQIFRIAALFYMGNDSDQTKLTYYPVFMVVLTCHHAFLSLRRCRPRKGICLAQNSYKRDCHHLISVQGHPWTPCFFIQEQGERRGILLWSLLSLLLSHRLGFFGSLPSLTFL